MRLGAKGLIHSCSQSRLKGFLLLELLLSMVLISIALVGLLDGYRASVEAHRSTGRRMVLRQLLQSRITDLEKSGTFSKGQQEGTFENNPECEWNTEITECGLESLFKLQVTVTGFGDSLNQSFISSKTKRARRKDNGRDPSSWFTPTRRLDAGRTSDRDVDPVDHCGNRCPVLSDCAACRAGDG
jgi:type II secretory pathway pseudopilin PulG